MRGGAVAARRAHNPKVAGSNPAPATKRPRQLSWSLFFKNNYHHSQLGALLSLAERPTCLYIVTFVKGSPKIPSWIAHERNRMLFAAWDDRNGFESSSL